MKIYSANSFKEIYEKVCELRQTYFKKDEIWFRGQGVSSWSLEPTLFRTDRGIAREQELFDTYKLLASKINLERNDEWLTLIDMQHYGIPTRLLDWTIDLGTALYFAKTSAVKGSPMSLHLMNPRILNEISKKSDILLLPINPNDKDKELSYENLYIKRQPLPATIPLAIKCSGDNARVRAQSGMFTIHGDESKKDVLMNELNDKNGIFKIEISYEAIDSLQEYFDVSGIDVFRIFPDIQGISRHLRDLTT